MFDPPKTPAISVQALWTALEFIKQMSDQKSHSNWGFALVEDHESALIDGYSLPWCETFLYSECMDHILALEVSQVLLKSGIEQIAKPFPKGTAIAIFKKGDSHR